MSLSNTGIGGTAAGTGHGCRRQVFERRWGRRRAGGGCESGRHRRHVRGGRDVDEAAPEPVTDSASNGNGSDEPEAETDDDQPKLDDIITLAADGSETASQDDIDALFD